MNSWSIFSQSWRLPWYSTGTILDTFDTCTYFINFFLGIEAIFHTFRIRFPTDSFTPALWTFTAHYDLPGPYGPIIFDVEVCLQLILELQHWLNSLTTVLYFFSQKYHLNLLTHGYVQGNTGGAMPMPFNMTRPAVGPLSYCLSGVPPRRSLLLLLFFFL